jgi:hypothetical protein
MPRLFRELSNREVAALLALAVWGVTHYVEPAPPKVVVMSTGPLDGAYQLHGPLSDRSPGEGPPGGSKRPSPAP